MSWVWVTHYLCFHFLSKKIRQNYIVSNILLYVPTQLKANSLKRCVVYLCRISRLTKNRTQCLGPFQLPKLKVKYKFKGFVPYFWVYGEICWSFRPTDWNVLRNVRYEIYWTRWFTTGFWGNCHLEPFFTCWISTAFKIMARQFLTF